MVQICSELRVFGGGFGFASSACHGTCTSKGSCFTTARKPAGKCRRVMLCMRRKQEFRRFNCGVDYQRKNIMQLLVAMSCGGDKEFRINRLYHWLKTVVRRIIESGPSISCSAIYFSPLFYKPPDPRCIANVGCKGQRGVTRVISPMNVPVGSKQHRCQLRVWAQQSISLPVLPI